MSLAHSKGHPKGQGKEGWQLLSSKKSSKHPRCISQPSSAHDATLGGGKDNIHVNGNTKPQEPPYLARRPSGSKLKPRMSGHIHAKPWCSSSAIGRKENPHHVNAHHRVWMSDAGQPGIFCDGVAASDDMSAPRRWNRRRKQEHYQKYEAELNASKSHDEMFAIRTNVKFWTHLQNFGTKEGGQEKLQVVPPRSTGLHLKHGLYRGKYANVKHSQVILKTGRKNKKGEKEEWQVDTRPMFDNRLNDDMIRYEDEQDHDHAGIAFGLFRPLHTRSCPQMGAEWMHR